MKSKLYKAFSLILAIIVFVSSFAVSAFAASKTALASGKCGEKATWTLYSDGELVISGTGKMTDYTSSIAPWDSSDYNVSLLTINEGITSVGDFAFNFCKDLVKVTIPKSVTDIGDFAFQLCDGLKSVTLSEGLISIGSYAFDYCTNLSSITIPSTVTYIGESAFRDCESLKSLIVSSSLIDIADDAFRGCKLLANSDGFVIVNDILFGYYGNNSEAVIPSVVTRIGERAFYNCESLTSVVIPSGVTSIGELAFYNCKGLTSVVIPDGVTSIGSDAFYGCAGLTSVTIPKGITDISRWAFADCSSLVTVTLPDTVNSIDEYAFYSCKRLESITLPSSVKSIGESAFEGCTSLKSLEISNDNIVIGNNAFNNCTSLYDDEGFLIVNNCLLDYRGNNDEVTVPTGVTSIGYAAFKYCSGLTSVTIPEGVTSIGESAFGNCSNLVTVVLPDTIKSIGNHAFAYCESLRNINIPSSVTEFGIGIFLASDGVTDVEIPETIVDSGKAGDNITWVIYSSGKFVVTGTGSMDSYDPNYGGKGDAPWPGSVYSHSSPERSNGTFYRGYASDITSIEISDGITSIDGSAFAGCENVKTVDLPSTLTSIGDSAFSECKNLSVINLPSATKEIGKCAFYGCKGLADENGYVVINGKLFYHFGKESTATIPSTVKEIGEYAFLEDYYVETVVLPGNITTIGDCAFYNTKIKNITIPSTVTKIGDAAFFKCGNLTSITIPSSVKSLGAYAFAYCENLSSITLPSSLKTIDDGAFYGCPKLADDNGFVIVKNILFYYCGESDNIVVPSGVTRIGECGIYISNASITIPNTVESLGYNVFGYLGFENVVVTLPCYLNDDASLKQYKKNDCFTFKTTHNYDSSYTVDKKATLSENGSKSKHCKDCDATKSKTTIYKVESVKLSKTSYTYDGDKKTPSVTVTDSKGNTLKKDTDYTVSYSSSKRKSVGKYTVTVKGKGNYSFTKKLTFKINPAKTSLKSLSAGSKAFTVKWTKKTTQVTGYEIQYSTSSKFSSPKTVTVKSYKTTSKTIKKLKAKKKYYVRIRTYKTVDGTKYYSSWSDKKSVATKK